MNEKTDTCQEPEDGAIRKGSARLIYLDIMRILAIYSVIFIHTGKKGYFLFSAYDPKGFEFWVFLFSSIFSKFAVALFFMISGGLLLNKKIMGGR